MKKKAFVLPKNKEVIDWRIVSVPIICLTLLEGYALFMGLDGILLTTVIAVIAGLAGWSMPQLKGGKNNGKEN